MALLALLPLDLGYSGAITQPSWRLHHSEASLQRCDWPICWLIWAVCSWNRSLSRFDMAMDFCTHRVMQPLSLGDRDLEVKSLIQDVKQWSTRLPKN